MKICILDDAYEESSSVLADVDIPSDPSRHMDGFEYEQHFLNKRTSVQTVIELAQRDFDVFLNLCDGAWDEDRPGIEVVQTLERMNVPFTGAASDFYEPSREKMKIAAHYHDVQTPPVVFASGMEGVERAARRLRFPLITKHPSSYSSIGMTKDSRVEDVEALRREAERMIRRFGAVMIEEFVEGREFTVLVAENPEDPNDPIVYDPVEFVFPEGESFKHFDMKWRRYGEMKCAECTDVDLARSMKEISARFFVALDGSGYGRCDIRVDRSGSIHMLEINPNCGVFYPPSAEGSADFVLERHANGHRGFLETIIRSAYRRVKKPSKWGIEFDRERGYGMYASRAIGTGELIERYEEKPHVLVTRSHVEGTWDERRRRWFERYAYPVSDEVYVMWSDDPEEWKPINHSCDPNAWLNGLNVVARRPIDAGEEITLDYATFCTEPMPDFECTCDAADCRMTITAQDHRKPFVDRYDDHVSDYVRQRRRAMSER